MNLRKIAVILLTLTSASAFPLSADDFSTGSEMIVGEVAVQPFTETNINTEDALKQPKKARPFNLEVSANVVGDSKIRHGWFEDDAVKFGEIEGELSGVFYYNPTYTEGALASISYTYTKIQWENNPWFEQNHFNTFSVSLGAFSKRLCGWLWRAQAAMNIDADQWNLSEYATYDLLLWGRYNYTDNIRVHIGFLAQTGMKTDRVYPIIGADWKISKQWKLNLVYPVNISLVYNFNPVWSIQLAARAFNVRYRVGPHEAHPRYIVRYQNTGAELGVNYETEIVTANIHGGYAFGGQVRIADRNNHNPRHYHFDSAAYGGAEVNVKF